MPDFMEMLDEAERKGFEWLVRSVSEDELYLSGGYFAHIHGLELTRTGYEPSYQGQGETAEMALRQAYENMKGAEQ